VKREERKKEELKRTMILPLFVFCLSSFMLSHCTPTPRFFSRGTQKQTERPSKGVYQIGIASYYGRDFHNRSTASGEMYDMFAFTCAHRTLPFGTRIKVTNLENGRWVIVRVNDRGPFVEGRILDLSYAAARKIGLVASGTAKVKIEIVNR